MGRQSTRHRYRTRREKNRRASRLVKLLLVGAAIFLLLMVIKNWREWWAYYKTYLY